MNFLGLGTMEILIVLLVAFIFLGPERMIDVARVLGRLVAQARRAMAELPRIDLEDTDITPAWARPTATGRRPATSGTDSTEPDDEAEGDGPVAFKAERAGGDAAAAEPESRTSRPGEDSAP